MPALRKKPISVPERKIEEVIQKGGSVPSEAKHRAKGSNFPLRFVHADMVSRIETARQKRQIKPSINTWINEAILDKLQKDEA